MVWLFVKDKGLSLSLMLLEDFGRHSSHLFQIVSAELLTFLLFGVAILTHEASFGGDLLTTPEMPLEPVLISLTCLMFPHMHFTEILKGQRQIQFYFIVIPS